MSANVIVKNSKMTQDLLRSSLKDKQEDNESSEGSRARCPSLIMWKITGKPGTEKTGLHQASAPPFSKVTADGNELQAAPGQAPNLRIWSERISLNPLWAG